MTGSAAHFDVGVQGRSLSFNPSLSWAGARGGAGLPPDVSTFRGQAESWGYAVVGGGLVWCDGIDHEIVAAPE